MSVSPDSRERRQEVRVDLLAELQGHIVTLDERVQVTQISLGGMTVQTTAPLSSRIEHDFRISFGDQSLLLKGRVMHSRVLVNQDDVRHLAGVQFIDPPAGTLTLLRQFIDELRTGND